MNVAQRMHRSTKVATVVDQRIRMATDRRIQSLKISEGERENYAFFLGPSSRALERLRPLEDEQFSSSDIVSSRVELKRYGYMWFLI
jgi:hypothetical protein